MFPRRFENSKTGKSGYAPVCRTEWQASICQKPKIACPYRQYGPHLLGIGGCLTTNSAFKFGSTLQVERCAVHGQRECCEFTAPCVYPLARFYLVWFSYCCDCAGVDNVYEQDFICGGVVVSKYVLFGNMLSTPHRIQQPKLALHVLLG